MTMINKKKLWIFSLVFAKLTDLFKLPQGTGLIILSAAFFGVTMVLSKKALVDLAPLTFLSIQSASSVMLFWTIVIIQGLKVPLNIKTLKIALAGLLEPGFSYIFGMFGLSLTSASNSSLINTTEPLVTILLSWLILREAINGSLIILGLIACIGVILVALPDVVSFNDGSMLGNCLVFVSVLFASLYTVTTSVAIKSLPPVILAALQQSVSLILFVAMTQGAIFLNIEVIHLTPTTFESIFIAIISGAFGYGLAFLLYLKAITYQPATKISLYLTLIPIFGVITAYIMLGERFMQMQMFGAGLILVTVAGISQLPQPKQDPKTN